MKYVTNILALALVFTGLNSLDAQNSGQVNDSLRQKTNSAQKPDSMKQANFQFTFISPVGTNGLDAPKTVNKFSVNWLLGVNGGVNGLEVGGFANIILKDVNGIQAAGFVNAVKGNVKGGQFAGFVNCSGGSVNGGQFAGFVNFSRGNVRGGQLAGFVNASTGNFHGAQLSGFANYNLGNFRGVQGCGYVNVNTGKLEGVQASGFVNVAGDVEGGQMAGFVNVAKKVKGFQLGFVNVADSVDGASIGFCNIVKRGLHQLEVSADELFYTNLSVRTGTHRFYNIFSTGFGSKNGNMLWQIGYGAGTSLRISDKWRTDFSLSAHHVSNGLLYHATSELYRFYWGVEYKLANKITLAGGPTFNLYWGDTWQPDFAKKYAGIAPYTLLNETSTYGFNYKAWVGARLALRFF